MTESVFPRKTLPVSVTGNSCALNCRHCGGLYLSHMKTLNCALKILCADSDKRKYSSILISGGCDVRGTVPILNYSSELSYLRKSGGFKIIAHTGYLPPEQAPDIGRLVDVVSFDVPPSDAAIRDVLGLPYTVEDYRASICALMKHAEVVPHVTIGLADSKLTGELERLEELNSLGLRKIVLNVLIPRKGTACECVKPPEIYGVVDIVKKSVSLFDFISIGCMRPVGKYRVALDTAVAGLVDRIVMPSRSVMDKMRKNAKMFYECCAL